MKNALDILFIVVCLGSVLWSSYESFVLYPRRLKAFRETRNDIVNGIIEDLKKSDQILVIKEKDGTKK
jgi:hypothetical protein